MQVIAVSRGLLVDTCLQTPVGHRDRLSYAVKCTLLLYLLTTVRLCCGLITALAVKVSILN